MVNSREITQRFRKDRDKVCRTIGNIIKKNSEFINHFILSCYISPRGRTYKYYLLTNNGDEILTNKFKYNIRSARFEYKYLNEIKDFLDVMNIFYIQQYSVDKYKIDLYITKYNIAIEIDEEEHKYKKDYDFKRQKYIEGKIHCKFIRINKGESCGSMMARIAKELY
ncbi:hypothetical protein IMSAGC011_01290 [Lachnospiraceae bacterium]|nr:hypothetical protein IMSAGC011_01290 [Lachnospiraceae bacterium]